MKRGDYMTVQELMEKLAKEPNKNKEVSVKNGCIIIGFEYILYDSESEG